METGLERLMLLLVLSDLALLVAPRLSSAIGLLSLQGVLLGAAALMLPSHGLDARAVGIAAAGVLLRGILFPMLLRRTAARAGVAQEFRPLVGYVTSIVLGVVMLGAAISVGARLPLPRADAGGELVASAALFTILVGLFLVVARRKALTQCLGYLVFENGIYVFGVAAAGEIPALVELGVLLDVFVAVLVMGVAAYRITEELDHMDTVELKRLRG